MAFTLEDYKDNFIAVAVLLLPLYAAFYPSNALLALVRRNKWFEKYKIDVGKEAPADLVNKAWHAVLLDHFLIQPILLFIISGFLKGYVFTLEGEIPAIHTWIWQFLFVLLVEDTTFYWLHALLHHRAIYKYVHKQHHEFKINVGFSAVYDHPLEAVANFITLSAGPLLIRPHASVFAFWVFYRVLESVDAHCAYRFPFSIFQIFAEQFQGGAERHEYHHSHNLGSYGSQLCLWDYFMGTDIPFRIHQIVSMTPVKREMFRERTRRFTFNLPQDAPSATKLWEAKKSFESFGDHWHNITVDGKAVNSLTTLPDKGKLSFTYIQKGIKSHQN